MALDSSADLKDAFGTTRGISWPGTPSHDNLVANVAIDFSACGDYGLGRGENQAVEAVQECGISDLLGQRGGIAQVQEKDQPSFLLRPLIASE